MQRPGQHIKTRTINVDGVIQELLQTLEARLTDTWTDWYGEDVFKEYLDQDLETFKGSIELMYKLDLIDKDRWDDEVANGYDLYNKIARKTA